MNPFSHIFSDLRRITRYLETVRKTKTGAVPPSGFRVSGMGGLWAVFVVWVFCFALPFPSLSLAAEGSGYTNNVNFTVSQDYIISSDVISKADIVANQFDGMISPDDLPGDYGDYLQEYIDNSWDSFQEWSFNQYSNALPSAIDDIHELNSALKNSHYYGDYLLTNESLQVGASNIMPAGNIVSNFMSVFRTSPGSSTNQNVFGIYRFGDWNSQESFFMRFELIPNVYEVDFDSQRDWGRGFISTMWFFNMGMRLLLTALTFWLVVKMCYQVVEIFSGGKE